jgi:3-deoxy-D-manno-octulosonic-acid transferase
MHAVSVGETLSGVTLARRLKEIYPQRPLIISTTTLTGQAVARERMPFADAVIYFPLDWAFCVRRALKMVRPAIVIIMETEIWPNFLRECSRADVPVVFISGRISDRSFARFKKYSSLFGFFLRPFFRNALSSASAFLMQTEKDAERIRAYGAPPDRVHVSGNLKYDMELPAPTALAEWLETEAKRHNRWPIIVAGSVVATEEPLALIAFGVVQGDYRNALLVLAPRKPERFDAAAEFIEESHRKFIRRSQVILRADSNGISQATEITDDVTVILIDSIGELASLYRIADGALVGGSLVESGGHNILEPAAFGKVPVFGPFMDNFADMASRFVAAGAAIQVENPEDAGVEWIHLLGDAEKNRRMGEAAKNLVNNSRGAMERGLQEIHRHMKDKTP